MPAAEWNMLAGLLRKPGNYESVDILGSQHGVHPDEVLPLAVKGWVAFYVGGVQQPTGGGPGYSSWEPRLTSRGRNLAAEIVHYAAVLQTIAQRNRSVALKSLRGLATLPSGMTAILRGVDADRRAQAQGARMAAESIYGRLEDLGFLQAYTVTGPYEYTGQTRGEEPTSLGQAVARSGLDARVAVTAYGRNYTTDNVN
jgi:hypothetical protein